ncbi:suppressor of fused domain protein [Silvimonas sp. JCM 19000]
MVASAFGSVAEHIEGHLGPISSGWSDGASSHGIQVVCFKEQPIPGITTYVTLGLSENELDLPKGRKIRQELVVSANDSFAGGDVAAFLLSLAEHIKIRGRAVLRGEVIGPWRPLISNATVNAVYVTNPTPFDTGFAEFSGAELPVIFALLVPITTEEAGLVSDHGWSWFEDVLESQDPDVWNLIRAEQIRL